jgi:hypothetical protein
MALLKKAFLQDSKDWNGWGAQVRTDGNAIEIQRTHALPIEKVSYDVYELISLLEEKAVDLADPEVILSSTGDGHNEKFLVVQGWSPELTPAEDAEAKRATFK